MSEHTDAGAAGASTPRCYRHPGRETYVRCSRCDRPICPDCMVPASVGFQCPECVREGARTVRTPRTVFGGRVAAREGVVTKVIIAACLVVFVLQQVLGDEFTARFWQIGLAYDRLLGPGLHGVGAGEWYRLVTVAFLHAGVLHVAFNLYALWLFGPPLEHLLGRARFVALYALSAVGAAATSYAFSPPNQPSVGASGAIFGLFGAFFVVNRHLGRDTSALVGLMVVNLVLGFVIPNIDWRAHVGGLVTGAVVAWVLVRAPASRRTAVQAGGCAAVLIVVLGIATVRTAHLVHAPVPTVLACLVEAPVDSSTDFLGCIVTAQAPELR